MTVDLQDHITKLQNAAHLLGICAKQMETKQTEATRGNLGTALRLINEALDALKVLIESLDETP